MNRAALTIDAGLRIPFDEIEFDAVRARGNGGQSVNTTASAIHLRFDVRASSLPAAVRQRLLALDDTRLNRDGVIVIKADEFRRQDHNRDAALARLAELVRQASRVPKPRKATQPSRATRQRRADDKRRRGRLKRLRQSAEA